MTKEEREEFKIVLEKEDWKLLEMKLDDLYRRGVNVAKRNRMP